MKTTLRLVNVVRLNIQKEGEKEKKKVNVIMFLSSRLKRVITMMNEDKDNNPMEEANPYLGKWDVKRKRHSLENSKTVGFQCKNILINYPCSHI